MIPYFIGVTVSLIILWLLFGFKKITLEFLGVKLSGDNPPERATTTNENVLLPNGASLEIKCGRVSIGLNLADIGSPTGGIREVTSSSETHQNAGNKRKPKIASPRRNVATLPAENPINPKKKPHKNPRKPR